MNRQASLSVLALAVVLLATPYAGIVSASPGWLIYDGGMPDELMYLQFFASQGQTIIEDKGCVVFTPPTVPFVNVYEVTGLEMWINYKYGSDFWVFVNEGNIPWFLGKSLWGTLASFDADFDDWYRLDLEGEGVFVTGDFAVRLLPFFIEGINIPFTGVYLDKVVEGQEEASGRSWWYDSSLGGSWKNRVDGDLIIRAEVEPTGPAAVVRSLLRKVQNAEDYVFSGANKGRAVQQRDTLEKKLGEVITMFERGNYQGGYSKLGGDLAPKLADPRPTPRNSWLCQYPIDSPEGKAIKSFAAECQYLIELARLADPRPTP